MIIHLDLDCFFVSCERLLNPKLNGIPVAVGGRGDIHIFDLKPAKEKKLITLNTGAFVPSLYHSDSIKNDFSYFKEGNRIRGIITTASYEARKYGIKTAMSVKEALSLCPHLIILPPNHLLYHTKSHELMRYLSLKIPVMEQYSIDEMFGDLKGWIPDENVEHFIKNLQSEIQTRFGLPVSIGASNSKWIAKLATGAAKPYGTRVITNNDLEKFVKNIPIDDFPGVGKAYSEKMKYYKIKTVADAWSASWLFHSWGRGGKELYARITGTDNEPVVMSRSRKGIGISRNMDTPIKERKELFRRIHILVRHWCHTIMKLNVNPTTFYFKLGYQNWQSSKKQYTVYRLFNEQFIQEFAEEKFKELDVFPHILVTYIGMSATKFTEHDPKSFNLLEYENDTKQRRLSEAIMNMREKYGLDIVKSGGEIYK